MTDKQAIVIKLSDPTCGHPQKLPYLLIEKMVDKTVDNKNNPNAPKIKLYLNSIFPAINDFKIQANEAKNTKNIKTACLLKSKTSEVNGKNSTGIKKIAKYKKYFVI